MLYSRSLSIWYIIVCICWSQIYNLYLCHPLSPLVITGLFSVLPLPRQVLLILTICGFLITNPPAHWHLSEPLHQCAWCSVVLRTHVHPGSKGLDSPDTHIPDSGRTWWPPAFMFQLTDCKQVSFSLFTAAFSTFLCFWGDFVVWKSPQVQC